MFGALALQYKPKWLLPILAARVAFLLQQLSGLCDDAYIHRTFGEGKVYLFLSQNLVMRAKEIRRRLKR